MQLICVILSTLGCLLEEVIVWPPLLLELREVARTFCSKEDRWCPVFRLVREITKSDYYFRHVRPSVYPSVSLYVHLSSWNNSTPTGRILMKIDIINLFSKIEKIHVSLKPDPGSFHEVVLTFKTISR